MNDLFLKLAVKLQTLAMREEGQDLVEYALVVALISVACVGSVRALATAINNVITSITGSLTPAAS
jgi:pilus assembly protein Flp/PilA